jgi:hypothetical protein
MNRGCPIHGSTECSCDLAYKIWSSVMALPSYGLLGNGDIMISRKAALEAIRLASDSALHDAIARLESRSFAANKRLDRLERKR